MRNYSPLTQERASWSGAHPARLRGHTSLARLSLRSWNSCEPLESVALPWQQRKCREGAGAGLVPLGLCPAGRRAGWSRVLGNLHPPPTARKATSYLAARSEGQHPVQPVSRAPMETQEFWGSSLLSDSHKTERSANSKVPHKPLVVRIFNVHKPEESDEVEEQDQRDECDEIREPHKPSKPHAHTPPKPYEPYEPHARCEPRKLRAARELQKPHAPHKPHKAKLLPNAAMMRSPSLKTRFLQGIPLCSLSGRCWGPSEALRNPTPSKTGDLL